ncbi:uncharacterized protein LOC144158294 [Haemaphysalis longicornis]
MLVSLIYWTEYPFLPLIEGRVFELQTCFRPLPKEGVSLCGPGVSANKRLRPVQEPLRNSIAVSSYLSSRVDKASQLGHPLYAGYGETDATLFSDFRLNPQMLSFPWYHPDAHIGVLLGGLGMRLAGVTFYDYVERSYKEGSDSSNRYLEIQRCFLPNNTGGEENLDRDLLGAVAAAAVIWDVYTEANETRAYGWSLREPLPSYTADELAFAFACWLNCGDTEHGALMCNTPAMHSRDFGRVFRCPRGSRMNPVDKCQITL